MTSCRPCPYCIENKYNGIKIPDTVDLACCIPLVVCYGHSKCDCAVNMMYLTEMQTKCWLSVYVPSAAFSNKNKWHEAGIIVAVIIHRPKGNRGFKERAWIKTHFNANNAIWFYIPPTASCRIDLWHKRIYSSQGTMLQADEMSSLITYRLPFYLSSFNFLGLLRNRVFAFCMREFFFFTVDDTFV